MQDYLLTKLDAMEGNIIGYVAGRYSLPEQKQVNDTVRRNIQSLRKLIRKIK